MPHFSMSTPQVTRSLPGLVGHHGLGVTDYQVTRILSGGPLRGIAGTGLAVLAISGGSIVGGALLGARKSPGWAAGGALIGLVVGSVVSSVVVGMAATRAVEDRL
jgi:hypothetical protein